MTDEDFFVLAKDLRPEKKNEKVAILQANNFLVEYRPGEKKVPFDPTSFKKLTAADTGPHPKYFMKNGDDLLRYAILAVNKSKTELLCKTGTNSKLRSCPIPKRLSHGDEVLPAKGVVLQAEKDQVREKKVSIEKARAKWTAKQVKRIETEANSGDSSQRGKKHKKQGSSDDKGNEKTVKRNHKSKVVEKSSEQIDVSEEQPKETVGEKSSEDIVGEKAAEENDVSQVKSTTQHGPDNLTGDQLGVTSELATQETGTLLTADGNSTNGRALEDNSGEETSESTKHSVPKLELLIPNQKSTKTVDKPTPEEYTLMIIELESLRSKNSLLKGEMKNLRKLNEHFLQNNRKLTDTVRCLTNELQPSVQKCKDILQSKSKTSSCSLAAMKSAVPEEEPPSTITDAEIWVGRGLGTDGKGTILKTSVALVENNRDREKRVQKLLDLLYGKDGVKKRSLSGFKGTELVTDKHLDTLLCLLNTMSWREADDMSIETVRRDITKYTSRKRSYKATAHGGRGRKVTDDQDPTASSSKKARRSLLSKDRISSGSSEYESSDEDKGSDQVNSDIDLANLSLSNIDDQTT